MVFKSNAATHVGMVRKLNEDSYAERSDIGVWVVADGMGGHEAGEVASQAVTNAIRKLQPSGSFDEIHEAVTRSLRETNRHLREQSDGYDEKRAPGSTVAALIIDGTQGAIVWAGDSRIYWCRDKNLLQLTRDHSHVQELVDQGLIKAKDAESHAMANVITRAIGIIEPVELEFKLITVDPSDQFLLCTDGLSRMVTNAEIESIMANRNSEEIVHSLLHTALIRGASDNVTLIYIQDCGDETDETPEDESTLVYQPFTREETNQNK